MNEEQRLAIEDFAAGIAGNGGILGNYIVIAEVMHEEGVSLSFAISENTAPWVVSGMLQSVAGMIDIASYDFDEPTEPPPGEDEEP